MAEQTPISNNSAPDMDSAPNMSSMPAAVATSDEKQMLIKLDLIARYLHNMDRRDRMRAVGGTIRMLIAIGYFAIVAWSTWYVFAHSKELMRKISEITLQQAMSASDSASESMIDRMREALG